MKKLIVFVFSIVTLSLLAQTPDFSTVPGAVIYHSPKSTKKFVGSPTICILPNGDYIAGCDIFGDSQAKALIFKSTDKGNSWEQIATINKSYWAGLFWHNDALYHMGADDSYGNFVIRKSTDGGVTWTNPANTETGLLLSQDASHGYHTSTTAVTVHNGRIWRALEKAPKTGAWGADFRAMIMSAPVDADLLNASSWTISNILPYNIGWKVNCNTWLEGNTVVAPDGKMKIMPRIDYRVDNKEKSALIDVSDDGKTISFNPDNFIEFPGGCKKFTVRFDQISQKYWALSNYVPNEFLTAKVNPIIERGRNTQALCSSVDLKNWKVESIYLQDNDILFHAFQYVDWVFDGDDIIVTSRTAHADGLGGAENSHNANMLTFHRIKNFRTMTMEDRYVAPKVNGEDVSVAGFENFISTSEISINGRKDGEGNLMSTLTVEDNPYKTGINLSDKAIKFIRNKGGFWGESVQLYFKGQYNTRYYLHFMIYAESQLTDIATIFKTDRKDDQTADLIMSYPPVNPSTGKWIDVVVPVPRNIKGVYGISIAPDRNLQATAQHTIYYIDNLVFSDDPTPRTTPVTKDDILGQHFVPIIGLENSARVNIISSDNALKIGSFKNGQNAFGNRTYIFENIPGDVDDWKFIRLNGGVKTSMTAQILSDGYLYRTVSFYDLNLYDLSAWEELNRFVPNYNDNLKSPLPIFRKAVTKGESIEIEQFGWAGSTVLATNLTFNEVSTGSTMSNITDNVSVNLKDNNSVCILNSAGNTENCHFAFYDTTGKAIVDIRFLLRDEIIIPVGTLSNQMYIAKIESLESSWKISKTFILN